jgi:drug/metabolite transporter (DMT)-like permease
MPGPSDTIRAALWMIGSIVSFSSMAIAGRAASVELDTFEILLYRSLIGVVLVLSVASYAGTRGQITTARLGTQALRNLFHFTGQNLWFYAITVAPLAQVFALEFTMPVWVMLLAVPLLGEPLTRLRVTVVALGFIGILIITQPWRLGIGPGILAAGLAAIGFAGSVVFTKVLTRTQGITSILFWLAAMQAVYGLICAGWDADITLPSAVTWPWLAVIGTAGLVAHFCLTKALKLAPATVVIPMDFTRLPIIAVVAMVLYGEPLELAVFVGAAVIFGANYLNIWTESRRPPASQAPVAAR